MIYLKTGNGMQNKNLTILITNYNTTAFVELLLHALKKLTKNEYNVLINDNGSSLTDTAKLLKLARKYNNVFLHFRDSKGERTSLAHGRALDSLMPLYSSKYTAVFDSDAVVLQKNWDEKLIQLFNDKVKIAGTPLAGAGNNPAKNNPKTFDFPFQFVLLFETEIFKQLNISWQPKIIQEQGFDTSWQLKPKYLSAGFEGKILIEKNTRLYNEGPFCGFLGVIDYYLNEGEAIFASHFGRGTTLGSAKYRKGTNFLYRIPKIGRLFRMARGKRDKKKWISICRQIIDKQ